MLLRPQKKWSQMAQYKMNMGVGRDDDYHKHTA